MTLAGLAIFICETMAIHAVIRKYFPTGIIEFEEFVQKASLPDVIEVSVRTRMAFFGFCIMSMGRLFQ